MSDNLRLALGGIVLMAGGAVSAGHLRFKRRKRFYPFPRCHLRCCWAGAGGNRHFSEGEIIAMAKDKTEKSNVMRLLEQKKLPYTPHDYLASGAVSGVEVAAALGEPPERVFKTLVTTGRLRRHYVFVIPVAEELDLKKAAKAVGEKSIAMLPQKELLPLTGYIHGGCSPIGMKKPFPTVLHESAADCETIYVSAGKIGYQVQLSPATCKRCCR